MDNQRKSIAKLPGISSDPLASYNPTLATPEFVKGKDSQQSIAADSRIPLRGSLIPSISSDEEFTLNSQIGRGGIGEVWEAKQSALFREVAIKRLRLDQKNQELDDSVDFTSKEMTSEEFAFYQEAILTANLSHPNIVPIYDLGVRSDGEMLMAMKLVRGELWDAMLRRDYEAMGEAEYLQKHLPILVDVAQALSYAHSRGIMHRDLKPQQVMVGEFGEVQLMDWGLAVIFDEKLAYEFMPSLAEATNMATRATAPNPAGTPAYMAPEQLDYHGKRLGPETDIFLVGAILYKILTGIPPHTGADSFEVMVRAMDCKIKPMQEIAPNRWIPTELDQLAQHCMQKDPATRLQHAETFIWHLNDFLTNAGRRWDSLDLTASIARDSNQKEINIKLLSLLGSQLDQAQGLWQENPEIEPLRVKIAAAHANYVATGDVDSTRAMLTVQRVSDKQLKDYLIAYLERQYAVSKRKKWFVFDLATGCITTFLLIFFVTLLILLIR